MSISGAFKAGFNFLSKLVDWISSKEDKKKPKEEKPKGQDIKVTNELTHLDMLRMLATDIELLPPQELNPKREVDICWALQLKFQLFRCSRDWNEIDNVLKNMRKLSFEKALKRFNSDCPGLPSMINTICSCLGALFDSDQEKNHITSDKMKEICNNGSEVCRNLLLPFIKRQNECTLFPDAYLSNANAIHLFSRILNKYSKDWPEDLEEQLRRVVELVPSVIKGVDLRQPKINEKLKEFANQVPSALQKLSEEHPEKWLYALSELCSRRPPKNIRGPLCRLWRRLVFISRSEGFGFLNRIIEVTFESLWNQIESATSRGVEDNNMAENIVGCVHDLVKQCWESFKFPGDQAFYWHNQIRPVVIRYLVKRKRELSKKEGPINEYLEKITSMIDSLPKRQEKEEKALKIKEIPSTIRDSDDSLCGAMTSSS